MCVCRFHIILWWQPRQPSVSVNDFYYSKWNVKWGFVSQTEGWCNLCRERQTDGQKCKEREKEIVVMAASRATCTSFANREIEWECWVVFCVCVCVCVLCCDLFLFLCFVYWWIEKVYLICNVFVVLRCTELCCAVLCCVWEGCIACKRAWIPCRNSMNLSRSTICVLSCSTTFSFTLAGFTIWMHKQTSTQIRMNKRQSLNQAPFNSQTTYSYLINPHFFSQRTLSTTKLCIIPKRGPALQYKLKGMTLG